MCVNNLVEMYKKDIDSVHFRDELDQSLFFIEGEDIKSIDNRYKNALEMKRTFPKPEIIWRILLTMPVGWAVIFFVKKSKKTYLRNTMSEDRLNFMSILYIENDLLKSLNYEALIKQFAKKNLERSLFNICL